jgi:flagellar biosynthesis chaperone FliJ
VPKQEILLLIEQKRNELTKIVAKNGLNSALTIQVSQELDTLLNQYNKYIYKEKKRLPLH